MFAKTTLVFALAGLAAAAPAPRSDSNVFGAVALRSGSPVQGAGINANGQYFYVGKPSSANCPAGVQNLDCSQFGNQTTFAFNPSTTGLALNVIVPGGQQVYVEANGALGYTIPHSASTPQGSYVSPFGYTPAATTGGVGQLTFENSSFSACPVEGEENVYQIFAAAVSPDTQTGCLSIDIGTATGTTAPVWQY